MTSLPALPALDLASYQWRPSATNPRLYQRRTCGAERVAAIKPHNDIGNHEGFIDLVLSARDPRLLLGSSRPDIAKIASAVATALVAIRLAIPSVANTLAWDADGECWIQNEVPVSTEQVGEWANSRVRAVQGRSSAEEVLERMERERCAEEGGARGCEAVVVWVFEGKEGEGEGVVHLLVQMNHVSFDGQGWFMVCGEILRGMGRVFEGVEGAVKDEEWPQTVERLELPAGLVLAEGQEVDGDRKKAAEADQLGQIMSISKGNWGLPTPAPSSDRQKVRILYHSLTVDESKALYNAAKHALGPKGTVTHIMHAAVYMAVLKQHPPSLHSAPGDQFFAFASPVDGRRNLSPEYANGAKTFFGLCQGIAVLKMGAALHDSARLEKDGYVERTEYEVMEEASKAAKAGYDRFLAQPSALSGGLGVMEFLAAVSKGKQMFPQGASLENPRFTSHGVLDKFVPAVISDQTGDKPLFAVKDVWFSLNQIESALNLRLYSFQGRSRIGLIWNGVSASNEVAQGFLDSVVYYLKLFARTAKA